MFLNEHEDVVDIDGDLLDELDLEDNVLVVDLLLVSFPFLIPSEFIPQVQIDTAIVLLLTLSELVIASEFVKGSKDVFQPNDRTKEFDELLFRRLAYDGVSERILGEQIINLRGVLVQVMLVRLEQHYASGIPVSEEFERFVGGVLEISEANDVAVGLDGVEDAIGAREGLQQPVGLQWLVDE